MKGDFTRVTFQPQRHYSSVRMQQGRVQLDADWNEQLDITSHRVETEACDLIGHCGAPLHEAGLGIAAAVAGLPPAQQAAAGQLNFQAGDLFMSAGRYYVDGILCENEQPVLATAQPDLPAGAPIVRVNNDWLKLVPPPQAGIYLVYVDVWRRHLTSVEAPQILESALGGPDTCTRTKTVWQVKLLRAGAVGADITCASEIAAWGQLTSKPTGQLAARAEPGAQSDEPCIVAPGAGYRRLENQLYRVEVHKSGTLGNATFKWSRDNGAVLTTWIDKVGNDLTVGSIGRDKPLGFAAGQWIELTDEKCDQLGQPGTLVQLVKAEGNVLTIDPATATGSVDKNDFSGALKIRRWDSAGALNVEVPAGNDGFIPLESGVEVKFSTGNFRTGDYWLIPARTTTGDVEWPKDPVSKDSIPQRPHGIEHHYCRLAVAQFNAGNWSILSDCRNLFPPMTELTELSYVGGDGQQMAPDPTQTKWLCGPLQVRVLNGSIPVTGARVDFRVTQPQPLGTATLSTLDGSQQGSQLTIATDADGLAAARWRLDAATTNPCQQATATLLDGAGQPISHQRLVFNGQLATDFGEGDLTRIVATSWRHGGSEEDLFPVFQPVGGGEQLAGIGFVIVFSDRVSVSRGPFEHVLEVLIPTPQPTKTASSGGGGMPFTLIDLSPQTIYQCWCPLQTGYDALGRPLAKIVPVTCALEGQSIAKAVITGEQAANGIAFLLERNSITHLLVNQGAMFDQFWVRLRCDFVLDERGRAVDGEFLRARLPSGDRPADSPLGIQGGLFESWFAFRGNYRGGYMVPRVENGDLRVAVTSFWRKTKAAMPVLLAVIDGGPPQLMVPSQTDPDLVTDQRYDRRTSTHSLTLPAGRPLTIDIRWEDFNRISHVANARLGGFALASRIVWDGRPEGTRQPIALDSPDMNPRVVRGSAFRASLNAGSPLGLHLSFDQKLAQNITRPAPGFTVDAGSGLMTIDAGSTPQYRDNPVNPGGDVAFSGNVLAADGSFVQFDGLFDGVDPG
jgi:uncharacterized protein DUF6519